MRDEKELKARIDQVERQVRFALDPLTTKRLKLLLAELERDLQDFKNAESGKGPTPS